GVNAVNLKPVLGKIETYRGNMHSGRLLSVVAFTDDHVMAHRCRGAGAVHPIKKFEAGHDLTEWGIRDRRFNREGTPSQQGLVTLPRPSSQRQRHSRVLVS
ncbi:MAG: hypothetical protein WBG11_08915, partial [Methylocella sp.]